MFYAIIGDIIDSRKLSERAESQRLLAAQLEHINQRYQQALASKFTLTLGDEFQGLLKDPRVLFQLIDDLRFSLPEIRFRFGIGVGRILTAINPEASIGADGPAYWRARQAIEHIHRYHHYETVHLYLLRGDEAEDRVFNHSLALSEFVQANWVGSQGATFKALLSRGIYQSDFNQKAMADALGLTSSAFAKRMKSSGIKLYLDVKNDLTEALIAYELMRKEDHDHGDAR